MGEGLTAAELLRDQRIARLAIQVAPVWLWRADLRRLLWANAAGAACFPAPTLQAIATYHFSPSDGRAAQVSRVAAMLCPGARPRLQRLRGFGPGIGQAIVCACSRIVVRDIAGILVAAQEPAGIDLPLAARIGFLLADSDEAIAAFAPEGSLIAATPSARARIGAACAVSAIGADSLAIAALAEGVASGDTRFGRASMIRVGHEEATALFAFFLAAPDRATAVPAPQHCAPAGGFVSIKWDDPAAQPQPGPATQATIADAAAHTTDEEPAAEPGPLRIEQPPPDRRVPLRFIWQMDQNGRFSLGSDEFVEAIGSRTAVVLGRPWNELAAELDLDPENAVLRAIETRDTWSGIVVSFPIDGSNDRVRVELSGLPVYDRNRTFLGYRGFGVCRDVERLTRLGWIRRAPIGPTGYPELAPVPVRNISEAPTQQKGGASDNAGSVQMLLQQTDGDPAIGAEATQEAGAAGEPSPSWSVRPENILLFPAAISDAKSRAAISSPAAAALSVGEHDAFREIARRLQARLASDRHSGSDAEDHEAGEVPAPTDAPSAAPPATSRDATEGPLPFPVMPPPIPDAGAPSFAALLNDLPVGLMIYRYDQPLFANRAFLSATGFAGLEDLIQAGGLDSLSVGTSADAGSAPNEVGQALTIIGRDRERAPIAARLFPVSWTDGSALALMLHQPAASDRNKRTELALRRGEAHIRELRSILDTTFDGLVVLSGEGVILSANRGAEVLFGCEPAEFACRPFGELFMPESRGTVRDYIDRVHHGNGDFVATGEEVRGQTRQGHTIPLSLILGKMPDGADRLYAVFRDLTPWKKAEAELAAMRQQAERGSVGHTDLLENFSNSVRDALNSITGFADLMLEERFGPLGDERYRGCLRDVRAASHHISGLVDDINDLSRAERGALDLDFVPVDLNSLTQGWVKALQAGANRDRTIVRSSLAARLRPVLADERSLKQVVGNLLANAIRHAGPGGQVIVSTGETEHGHVFLRVRDTGAAGRKNGRAGKAAPPLPGSAAGAGVDMVLTRTLAEANRGTFNISSKANEGTLFEVSFPGARIPAE